MKFTNGIILSSLLVTIVSVSDSSYAAIIFTNDVNPQNDIFVPSTGDTLTGNSIAENTEKGFKITAPEPLVFTDTNGDGTGSLGVRFVTRDFEVRPPEIVIFSLSVNGRFTSPQVISVTPNLTLLNNRGGNPVIRYDINDQNFPNTNQGNLIFSESQGTQNKINSGELELSGGFNLSGPPGFTVTFNFPNSIDASVSVPEPTSTLSLLALGTLGAGAALKRKLKPSKSPKKKPQKLANLMQPNILITPLRRWIAKEFCSLPIRGVGWVGKTLLSLRQVAG